MNKIKAFFASIALIWLFGCGVWAISRFLGSAEIAWFGLLVNAWALPLWMLFCRLWPGKFRSEEREPPAFSAVLVGLAIALLGDSEKGLAVYLGIYNLFVFLLYLHYLRKERAG